MAIEHAAVQVVRKPWGVADLHPWSGIDGTGDAVGELWFQRVDRDAPIPALLLKLLFTSEPLSIQVHPDDAFARSIGLPNGKTEAWYILAALPDARIAVGLKRHLTPQELRASIKDGSIAGLAQWRRALALRNRSRPSCDHLPKNPSEQSTRVVWSRPIYTDTAKVFPMEAVAIASRRMKSATSARDIRPNGPIFRSAPNR